MDHENTCTALTPHLVVAGAAKAIDFYVAALGARELERFAEPSGFVVHAQLAIGGATFTIADERPEWQNLAPSTLGGSPVVLTLVVDDPDAVAARMVERGARIVFPIADQFYGKREGRLADPFGHVWVLSKLLVALTPDEIQRRMDDVAHG